MATRTCPNCGTQYIATVRRCLDCDAALVDDDGSDVGAGAGAGSTGDRQAAFGLSSWGNQLKVTLEGMLDRAGIPRAWESGSLLVPAAFTDEVADLIATVEGHDAGPGADDAVTVALAIEGLDRAGHDELDARLIADSIAHAWNDDGDLLVAETDEERVLALIDEVFELDETDLDDGLVVADALSALYVAVDRLVKRSTDTRLRNRFVDAAETLGGLGVPYGFSGEAWADLSGAVADLADRAAADPAADDEADDGPVDDDGDDGAVGPIDDPIAADPLDDADDAADSPVDGDGDGDGDDGLVDRGFTTDLVDLRRRLADLV